METVLLDRKSSVAIVTLNRPEQLNAINRQLIFELGEVVETVAQDKDVHCVIVTGAGDRAFAAGADITQMKDLDCGQAREFVAAGCKVVDRIETLPVPVIAAINGFALGGGMEIALACDIRIASGKAVFGLPETTLGIMPGWGGTMRLPKIAGYAMAAELIFSGQPIKAERALACGIINSIEEPDGLMDKAMELAETISKNAPLALQNAKLSMQSSQSTRMENQLFAQLFMTQEPKTRMEAFLTKKK